MLPLSLSQRVCTVFGKFLQLGNKFAATLGIGALPLIARWSSTFFILLFWVHFAFWFRSSNRKIWNEITKWSQIVETGFCGLMFYCNAVLLFVFHLCAPSVSLALVFFFLFVAAFCRFCWSWNWRASAAAKGQQPRANGSQLQAFCRGLCWLVDACQSLCWANLIPNHSLTFRVAFGLYQIQPDTCCLRRGFFPWMVFVFVPKNLRIHQIIINLQVNRKGCVLLRCGVESHRFKYTARFFDLFISPCFHLLTFFGFLRERSLGSAGQE